MRRQRVIVGEGRGLTAAVVRALIEPVADVVRSAATGPALIAQVIESEPDVVVCDFELPRLGALDAARVLRLLSPNVRMVIVAGKSRDAFIRGALEAGVSAWVLRSGVSTDLVPAIRAAIRSERFVSPLVSGRAGLENGHARQPRLTDREREVIQLLADGKPMREAAAILSVTPRTIAFHKYRAMKKLGVKSSAELIRLAVTERLVS